MSPNLATMHTASTPMLLTCFGILMLLGTAQSSHAQSDDVYWMLVHLDDETCAAKGKDSGCVRVCRIQGDDSVCYIANEAPEQFSDSLLNSYLCAAGQCLPASVREKASGGFVVAFENTLKDFSCHAEGTKLLRIGLAGTGPGTTQGQSVPAEVPANVADGFTWDKCEDCWKGNRMAGWGCEADDNCYQGFCGRDPSCDPNGPAGPDFGEGSGESCGEPFSVENVSAKNDAGEDCLYTGEVIPTLDGLVCVDVIGDGFFHDCESLVVGVGGTCLETIAPGELPGN